MESIKNKIQKMVNNKVKNVDTLNEIISLTDNSVINEDD